MNLETWKKWLSLSSLLFAAQALTLIRHGSCLAHHRKTFSVVRDV